MPSVADVMSYADSLRVSPLSVVQDRCVAVRNRNASCRRCVEACLASAITVSQNQVSIDASACVDCGACASVCPTSALQLEDPSPARLSAQARERADAEHGLCVIACARAAARHVADAERFAEAPCLGHVSDHLLVELAAVGLDDIVLVDGDCGTCKYGAASSCIDASVACAADLLDAVGASAIITRASEFPPEVLAVRRAVSIRGEDRRGILLKTGDYLRRAAGNVAQKALDEKLGGPSQPRTLRDRLNAGKSGRMPTFQPEGNFALLEGLERASADPASLAGSEVVACTRRFGRVEVDADACSGCGLCVLFCPTAALAHAEHDRPEREDRKFLEFSAEACTQCRLCEDVCMRRCLEVSSSIRMRDAFDLEPALIEISRPRERTSIFDLKKR